MVLNNRYNPTSLYWNFLLSPLVFSIARIKILLLLLFLIIIIIIIIYDV